MTDSSDDTLVDLTVGIVSAYVANNTLPTTGLAGLIAEVHSALGQAVSGITPPPKPILLQPAVSTKKSVTPNHIVCLEDGKAFKSLKRHLRTAHGLAPEAYREKWDLPADYPMVAPNYAAVRSKLAKEIGLGNRRSRGKR